jgi:tetratricopeptide (TPR) repeat protein
MGEQRFSRSSTRLLTALAHLCRFALIISCAGALLSAAIFLVFAYLVFAEGKHTQSVLAFAGGVVSLFSAWLVGKGAANIRRRLNDRVIAETAQAIRFDSLDPIAHNNRGYALAKNGEHARAIAHFDAAIRLNPTIPNPYVGRVNAYGAIGQWDRVIAEYTAAISRNPNNALAYCARATALNGCGRFDRSISDATEAIRLDPRLYLGYDARGYGLLQRGSFNWPLKLIAIAWMAGTLGFLRRDHFDWTTPTGSRADFEQAIADFTEALLLEPAALDCNMGRARAYRALGEHAKAAADEGRAMGG